MADAKISQLTELTTPANADVIAIVDDDVSTTKKLSWSNIKATLKTYFDTVYASATGNYSAGGTDVALADGGTGASLADPGADRILFWDDSAGAMTWLSVGSGLSINDTTLGLSGGSLTVLTATGTVDDSNTAFTFATAPTIVVINGNIYRDGAGVSISGTSVTTDWPVGIGGDIYGLG